MNKTFGDPHEWVQIYDFNAKLPIIDFSLSFEEFLRYRALNPDRYHLFLDGVSCRDHVANHTYYIGFKTRKDRFRFFTWRASIMFDKRMKRIRTKFQKRPATEEDLDAKMNFLKNVVQADIDAEMERGNKAAKEAAETTSRVVQEEQKGSVA